MLRSLLVLIILAVGSGCGPTEVTLDGAVSDAAGGPTGRLTLESDSVLALTFGEEAEVTVRYTEDGRPVSGVEIRFALVGRAQSSGVADLALVTDAEGRVRTRVIAGETAVVFRLRVAAERAAAVFVDVSVGDMGFGGLVVRAVYEGDREEAARRVVSVYSGTECDPEDGYPRDADRVAVLDAEDETQAQWSALSAGLRYTIVGRVEGPGGAALATACTDGVEIVADEDTLVDLSFSDAQLLPDGRYETHLELLPADLATSVIDDGMDAGLAAVGGAGASLYLDALEEELSDRGETAAAAALAAERVSGTADTSLGMRLDEAGEGPEQGLRELVARLDERLDTLRLVGPMELRAVDGALTASWTPDSLEVGPVSVPDGPAPFVSEMDAWAFDPAPTMTLGWDGGDEVALESLSLSLPVGSLVVTAISAAGMGDPSAAIREGAGCGVLAGWISESPTLGPACDATCAETACTRALGRVAEALTTALQMSDELRSEVTLEGALRLVDQNGDLTVDALESGALTGRWAGASVDAPIDGSLVADRMVD